ncbi:hypothetical protein [Flavobacterium sp. SM2513]|uniref:hypothetical protein n=1 Tax=Flavobacterium sp. SM2513 TaxID=3424766 RepID=UPI003D7FCA80
MEFNNLQDVISCLREWETIRNNPSEVIQYLSLGNHFAYKRDMPQANQMHVYPGVCKAEGTFYIFMLDAAADINSSEATLFNAITICQVKNSLGNSDEIPEAQALKRMDDWKKSFSQWATNQINNRQQTQGIFKAFNMPSSYIERNVNYSTFFALREDSTNVTGYIADLITVDHSKSSVAFYDTVLPVPPFGTLSQNSFYLLSMV